MAILTIIGIVKTLIVLEITVNEIHKAVSPFPKWVRRLDVGPPGHIDKIINPIASSGLSCKRSSAIEKPKIGNSTNCVKEPTKIAFGDAHMRLKSFSVRDSPSPNIMTNKAIGRPTVAKTFDTIIKGLSYSSNIH